MNDIGRLISETEKKRCKTVLKMWVIKRSLVSLLTGAVGVHLLYWWKYDVFKISYVAQCSFVNLLKYWNCYVGGATLFFGFVYIKSAITGEKQRQILAKAQAEADEIIQKAELHKRAARNEIQTQFDKLAGRRALLEEEYQRKNMAKTLELDALRRQVETLKKNQYDPRKSRPKKKNLKKVYEEKK